MKKVIPIEIETEAKIEYVEGKPSYEHIILPPLLTVNEICEYTGLSGTIVRDMIEKGEIPSIRIRSRIRVFATDLRVYLDSNRSTKK